MTAPLPAPTTNSPAAVRPAVPPPTLSRPPALEPPLREPPPVAVYTDRPLLRLLEPLRTAPLARAEPAPPGEPPDHGLVTEPVARTAPTQARPTQARPAPARPAPAGPLAPQPDPARQIRTIVRALLEILNGRRAVDQLRPHLTWMAYLRLSARVRRVNEVHGSQLRAGGSDELHIGRPVLSRPEPGITDASIVVRWNGRVQALSLRMEQTDDGWRCSLLEFVR